MPLVAELVVVIVGVAGPLMKLQAPVPLVAVLPAMVAVPAVAQMVWSTPAFATVGGAIAVMTTSSVEAVQGELLTVQRNVRAPAVVRPVIVDEGEPDVVMVAAVPPTCVQTPAPSIGVLAARVTVATDVQTDWSAPAAEVVGTALTVTLVLPLALVPHQFRTVTAYVPVAAPVTEGFATPALLNVPVPLHA
jgi:hypothetical protein